MVRKSKAGQRKQAQQYEHSADMLNFHLPERPKAGQQKKSATKQKRHPVEDRATAQRKSGLFPLHASPDHRFVISRKNYEVSGAVKPDSYQGPDSPVAWSTVKIVHQLSSEELTCPICLDTTMLCPRITKCGHAYCFTCLIHHVQASQSDVVKCPCCSVPIFLQDLRPVHVIVTVATTRFVKLHRERHSSVPYVPQIDFPRRRGHCLPCMKDKDASFTRFSFVDPPTYQQLLHSECQDLLNDDTTRSTTMEELCRSLALQMIQQDLSRAETELAQELKAMEDFRKTAETYHHHPKYLIADKNPLHAKTANPDDYEDSNNVRRGRVDSIASATSCGSSSSYPRHVAQQGGSMYADEQEEYTLYQAENGTLCFLSGFNMSCLRTEFAMSSPPVFKDMATAPHPGLDEGDKEAETRKPPLPDVVEGRVIEVEHMYLTPEIRQRRRFLSHLPLYTDICFVELNLGSYLSSKTKNSFRKEFQKRKQKRVQRANVEKRADKKILQQEKERINGLKALYQQIDPLDEFFQHPPPAEPEPEQQPFSPEDFGPAAARIPVDSSSTRCEPIPGISFSQVCRSGEDFPSVEAAPTEMNFPALGSTPTLTPVWGPSVKKPQPPALTTLSSKKGKPKKLVLFSTGAQRGDYF